MKIVCYVVFLLCCAPGLLASQLGKKTDGKTSLQKERNALVGAPQGGWAEWGNDLSSEELQRGLALLLQGSAVQNQSDSQQKSSQ